MKTSVKKQLTEFAFALLDIVIIGGLLTLVIMSQRQFITDAQMSMLKWFILAVVAFKIIVLFFTNSYKIITESFGFVEALLILGVSFATSLISYAVMYFISSMYHLPLELCLVVAIAEATLMVGIRCVKRFIRLVSRSSKNADGKRTIIVGAGAGGKLVLDEIRDNRGMSNKIVAFVDDNTDKINHMFSTYKVEGPISNISKIIKKYRAEEVIIAIADIDKKRLYEILGYMSHDNVKIKRLPLFSEVKKDGKNRVFDVDINELLSRDPVVLDNDGIRDFINGKVVLVTGAGGSIGSELVRQIFKNHPSKIILFDIYENGVYDIQQDLVRKIRNENIKDIELVTLIGSTYNPIRMEHIFKKYRPELVFHAAAYKHVPLMEDSPVEAIRTNVIGTYNVAKLADKYGVKKMVLVSTDKAVRPTNVMGATKRFAETIIQYFAEKSKTTAYSAVRFGNVLGSNGSVIPLFRKQIAEGGPVTVTSKEMTRFFMTIPEAVSLILQSGVYATGGEIFILDMGQPVKIIDLAEKLIRQEGYIPYVDMDIIEIGLRPGEKMYEEILLEVSEHTKTDNDKIYVEKREAIKPIEEEIKFISQAFDMEENEDIKKLLGEVITTYHEPKIVNN